MGRIMGRRKICSCCHRELSVSLFSRNRRMRDGLHLQCKDCNREYREANKERLSDYQHKYRQRHLEKKRAYNKLYWNTHREYFLKYSKDYRQKNREYLIEYDRKRYKDRKDQIEIYHREYRQKFRAKISEYNKEYRKNNSHKQNAHDAVSIACKKGILIRPEKCQSCGVSEVEIQAHHEDYSYPLRVEWLCRSCHSRLHSSLKRKEFIYG